MNLIKTMREKSFDVNIVNYEMFQRTDVIFSLYGDKFIVPNYDEDDERWQTDGLYIGKYTAQPVTEEEYKNITEHYEDDFICWQDVCEALEESKYSFSDTSDEDY